MSINSRLVRSRFLSPYARGWMAARIGLLSPSSGAVLSGVAARRVARGLRRPNWSSTIRPVVFSHSLSTAPLDGLINPIRAAIQPRAYGLRNRERTNRLLMLMQLHANRQDDQHAYVRYIRDCLEANRGRPSIGRRVIIDTGRAGSLH